MFIAIKVIFGTMQVNLLLKLIKWIQVSKRIELYGFKSPVIGDLVIVDKKTNQLISTDQEEEEGGEENKLIGIDLEEDMVSSRLSNI